MSQNNKNKPEPTTMKDVCELHGLIFDPYDDYEREFLERTNYMWAEMHQQLPEQKFLKTLGRLLGCTFNTTRGLRR